MGDTKIYVLKDGNLEKLSNKELLKLCTIERNEEKTNPRNLKQGVSRNKKCSLCDYGAPSRGAVVTHINSMHKDKCINGLTPYHLIENTGEHLESYWLCKICNSYKSQQEPHVKRHIEKAHKQKPSEENLTFVNEGEIT